MLLYPAYFLIAEMEYHLEKKDATIDKIVKATFPHYKGRTIKLSTEIPRELNSYWVGGSKDSYVFYELSTGRVLQVEDNHPFFQQGRPRVLKSLPEGLLLVNHNFFCGQDMGITIYANNSNLAPLLPEFSREELSREEKIVLEYTFSYISSSRNIKDLRFHEAHMDTGISLGDWNKAKASLIEKKLLNKRGAITPRGKNYLAPGNVKK